ncbi:GAF domain-containing protein [Ramlibacter tataouinensis]|uniref:GAF domain-containing protein n=1 Tax=Ramlibacter tataouinensis TaxID=94132 RepID=UPI0022F3E35F|nr:GAF domain-containing protein [Ramlibacter tataouinensis]WBY03117.1 GAF domain-containing protein [Ramlibacter tataouinensis]
MQFLDYHPDDIDVRISELLVATSDAADPLVHPKVKEALRVVRDHLDMDVVFVSQLQQNRRTFRVVDAKPGITVVKVGHSDPVEESWCHHVVNGRLPQFIPDAQPLIERGVAPATSIQIGTHLSAPILLKGGGVYGTICCFSHQVDDRIGVKDLQRLQAMARILAVNLDDSGAGELQLQPKESRER